MDPREMEYHAHYRHEALLQERDNDRLAKLASEEAKQSSDKKPLISNFTALFSYWWGSDKTNSDIVVPCEPDTHPA